MYKEAIQLKLRIKTPKGELSVEQAMSLSLKDLETSIKSAHEVIKKTSSEDEGLGFLNQTSTVKREDQLAFDILKDIYVDKRNALEDASKARDIKAHNDHILSLIAKKESEALEGLSVEDLRKQLK